MIKSIIKNKFNYLEPIARNIYYSIPDKIRYGNKFRINYNFLKESQYFNKEKQEEYQLLELKKIIKHSYETVPYYNKLFNDLGIKPEDIKEFSDIKKIPYLTKEIIQNNIDMMISSKYKKENIHYVTTSGSTGTPLGFYVDAKNDNAREWSFITHMWSRIGYDISKNNKTVYLRGHKINSKIYEYTNNSLVLSSYDLNDVNIQKYIELIIEYNPKFIQAYPSSIYMISEYINRKEIKLKIKNLKAIICASENLYDFQKHSIKKAFNVRVYSFYGHTEHSCIGGGCEISDYYHIQSEYGYTEIINENGEYVQQEDEIGEIVVTGFNNYVMPFIRYKTEDRAINTNEQCDCGRGYKLIKRVEGRKQEQIITSDGSKVALTSIINAQHFNAFGKMKSLQLEQKNIGELIVRIVEREKFNNEDINEIITKIVKSCNGRLNVKVDIVNDIERTARGKYKYFIQNLKL